MIPSVTDCLGQPLDLPKPYVLSVNGVLHSMEGPFQFLKLNFSMNRLAKNYILLSTKFRPSEGKASPQRASS